MQALEAKGEGFKKRRGMGEPKTCACVCAKCKKPWEMSSSLAICPLCNQVSFAIAIPEVSAAMKKRSQDPEYRAKQSTARQDPEYQAKMRAARKAAQ